MGGIDSALSKLKTRNHNSILTVDEWTLSTRDVIITGIIGMLMVWAIPTAVVYSVGE